MSHIAIEPSSEPEYTSTSSFENSTELIALTQDGNYSNQFARANFQRDMVFETSAVTSTAWDFGPIEALIICSVALNR